mmetsp:Transcript_7532/g.27527  ORF Transcript_7532/g.27527 Transcript_7532/m.27527 type:complete len:105 (+) Transcript_7532:52-366(+)
MCYTCAWVFLYYLPSAASARATSSARTPALADEDAEKKALPPRKLGSRDEHPIPRSIPLEEMRSIPRVEPSGEATGETDAAAARSMANRENDWFRFITGFSSAS